MTEKHAGEKTADNKVAPEKFWILYLRMPDERIKEIQSIINNWEGVYRSVIIDAKQGEVFVKGTLDVKALHTHLRQKLNCPLKSLPAKKDGGGDKKGGRRIFSCIFACYKH